MTKPTASKAKAARNKKPSPETSAGYDDEHRRITKAIAEKKAQAKKKTVKPVTVIIKKGKVEIKPKKTTLGHGPDPARRTPRKKGATPTGTTASSSKRRGAAKPAGRKPVKKKALASGLDPALKPASKVIPAMKKKAAKSGKPIRSGKVDTVRYIKTKVAGKKVALKKPTVKNPKIEKIEETPVSKPKPKMKPGDKRKNNGGARKGSGRKPGAAKQRTKGIADDLAASVKITPLEYMLDVLNETPDQLIKDHKDGKIDAAEFMAKFKALTDRRDWAAEKSAVYLHPRLSSITASITTPEHEQYVKEREVEIVKLLAAAARKKVKPAK